MTVAATLVELTRFAGYFQRGALFFFAPVAAAVENLLLAVTALGYVLTVLSGRVLLAEQVTWQRWAGTLMIVAGVSLVGNTPIRTTASGKAVE